ncbi:unnamed protein product [Rotaria sp. Silwood1]|nr:unnamed protein product [Rotaria sp. Silwood1]CAF3514835.1 unnamed protein product [Rotaria sp. Silwood1]CAF3574886.1 unnamed protein product [Rotaria sp. Silwood1]CAF4542584.1 unnamed protein product [Rotaria sp. Silwood1]CAF4623963.1 unnamed protein product [Rotaria sp. Silwood1]
MATQVSSFLVLPDEILLEIYKYLLNAHVLYSFYGLNERLNTCITGYCRHISLTDVTCNQFHHLCRSILPEIGFQIRSLLISNCRSVLQGKIFSQYFSHQMSTIFPNLQKLILVCFTADELDIFLNTLNNLSNLDQIEISDLLSDQSNLFQHVIETNNNRFTSITFKTSYSDLPTYSCLNILDLNISIQTLDKLPDLLSFIPNIRRLNINIDEISMPEASFDNLSPLIFLNYFFLRCYNHFWLLAELKSLFEKIPAVECLSLQLSSQDNCFVDSKQKIFDILPQNIREFNFSLRYFYDTIEEIDQNALIRSRFPIICLLDENLQQAILHTIPYRFPLFNISYPMAKQMSTYENYKNIEMFYDYHGMALAETFPIISRCRRIKEIAIQSYEKDDESPSVQQPLISLPYLYYLKRIWLLHSSREYNSLKTLLQIAPNLSELFIAFDNLLPIFDDKDTCQLLGNHIIHLLILRSAPTAPTPITEQYVPYLVRIFTHLRHLQIDVTNGTAIELITLAIINAFKEQTQLISLVVEGQSSCNELKSNARKWLIDNTYLTNDGNFDAEFKEQTNRFLLWM